MILRSFCRLLKFATRSRPAKSHAVDSRASGPTLPISPIGAGSATLAPEFVYFGDSGPYLRLPTGDHAATMLQAAQVLHWLPDTHPDRLEMEVRLRRLAGSDEVFAQWMRAGRFMERYRTGSAS